MFSLSFLERERASAHACEQGVEWEGRELLGDARPSRDLELQSNAAFRAVVSPASGYRLPAVLRLAGWQLARGKQSRSAGLGVKCRGGALTARIGRRRRQQG